MSQFDRARAAAEVAPGVSIHPVGRSGQNLIDEAETMIRLWAASLGLRITLASEWDVESWDIGGNSATYNWVTSRFDCGEYPSIYTFTAKYVFLEPGYAFRVELDGRSALSEVELGQALASYNHRRGHP